MNMADTATRAAQQADDTTKPKSSRGGLLGALGALVVIGALAWGGYYFTVASKYVSTDNAYVGADTAQITPLISGPVREVHVRETQQVNAGDVLVVLDDADATLALAEAQADLARAQANLSTARTDLSRRTALAPGGAVSADELTAAQNAYDTGAAAVAAAGARVNAAQLALSRTTIRAPIAGVVSHKNVDVGQRVEAGSPLMVIAPIDEAYVDANFKEGQLRRVAAGQPVTLHSDLYGDSVTYHGVVAGLSGGTGAAFSLIPAQNASGNWIKVVQRVPVRIALDRRELDAHPLRVGMSMTAEIDVSGDGSRRAQH
jgi:membrane fusion protein (multidrug efflux system)